MNKNLHNLTAAVKGRIVSASGDERGHSRVRRGGIAMAIVGLIATTVWVAAPNQPATQSIGPNGVAVELPHTTEAEAVKAAKAAGRQVEVLAERGQSKQVFANPDGTITAYTFEQPIQMVQNGKWVPTDPTLVRYADGTVGPRAALTNLRLSGGGDGLFASVERAGRRYALTWPGTLPAPVLDGDTATYAVLPDVDLVVRASVTGFTHVLVVKTREAAQIPQVREIRFGLTLKLLKVQQTASGGLRMVDTGTGGTVFETATARMWDSAVTGGADIRTSPPDGARMSRVGAVPAGGSLTLQPDLSMLDAPDTVFPVHIDPFTASTTNESWAMVDSGYPSEEYWKWNSSVDERVGMCPWQTTSDCGSNSKIKRLYFVLSTSYSGKTIIGAQFGITQTHTWNSTAYPVSLYRANFGGALITSATNWSNRPTNLTLQQTISPTGESSCQTGTTRNVWFTATESVQRAVSSGWTKTTYMIRAANESDDDYVQLKRYCHNAVLSVTYNQAPNQAAITGLSMNPGGACVTGSTRPYVSSIPQLKAVLSDPDSADAEPLTAEFQVYWTPPGGIAQSKTWTSSELANGSTFSYNLADPTSGVPNLPENVVVTWKVRADDGTTAGLWSDVNQHYCEFVYDKTKPVGPDIDSPEYLAGDATDSTPDCKDDDPAWFDGVGRYTTFTFDSTATDVAEYWWDIDTTPTAAKKLTPATLGGPVSVLWQPQESKVYTINVIAVDQAGKTSDTSSCVFRVAEGRGPVAEWHLDDAAGATTGTDATGAFPLTTGTTTQFGATGPQGAPDRAAHFDGTLNSGLFTAGSVVDTSKNFTVSAWVKLTDLTKYQTILSQDGTGEPGFQIAYSPSSGSWNAQVANNDVQSLGSWGVTGTAAVKDKWTHLAAAFDVTNQKITLYVDGAVAGTPTNWRAPWTSHGSFQIGRRLSTTSYSEGVYGDIAEVRVYDRAVVPGEAATLKYEGAVTARLGYWDLDGATLVADNSSLVATSSEFGIPQTEGDPIVDPALNLNLYTGATWAHRLDPEDPEYDPFNPVEPLVGDGHMVLGTDTATGAQGYASTAAPVAVTNGSFSIATRVQTATDCAAGDMSVMSQPGDHASVFDLGCTPDGSGTAKWRIRIAGADQVGVVPVTLTASGPNAIVNPQSSAGQFLIVTYDAAYKTLRLYVDGVLAGTLTDVAVPWLPADNPADGGDGLQIGRALIGGNYGSALGGAVDEIRVYNGVLDATTVSKLAVATADPSL